jgi:uncharacterized protein YqeY
MNVLDQLKEKALMLRKTKSDIAPSIVFAVSEIEKVGKNSGNRTTNNDEAIKVVQKLLSTIEINITFAVGKDDRLFSLNQEKNILMSVLPIMATEDEIRFFLESVESPQNKGVVMKALKEKFGVLVDMKQAGAIVSEIYSL